MPDKPPDKDASPPAAASAFEDIPILTRVELTTMTLTARECAALKQGDVLQAGVRVGHPVSLRAGGVVIARGELCNLDGNVGIRILETQQGESK